MINFTNIKIFTKRDVHFPEVEVEVKNQEIADFLSKILFADFRYT
jgi:hypothetical protein